MDCDMIVAIVTMITSIKAAVAVMGMDGRSSRKPRKNIFTISNNTWEGIDHFNGLGAGFVIVFRFSGVWKALLRSRSPLRAIQARILM